MDQLKTNIKCKNCSFVCTVQVEFRILIVSFVCSRMLVEKATSMLKLLALLFQYYAICASFSSAQKKKKKKNKSAPGNVPVSQFCSRAAARSYDFFLMNFALARLIVAMNFFLSISKSTKKGNTQSHRSVKYMAHVANFTRFLPQ